MKNHTIQYIDATGLACPMPLMLLKKTIKALNVGEQVNIDVTDIHAELDFETWCERFGHDLIKCSANGKILTFKVIKGQELHQNHL